MNIKDIITDKKDSIVHIFDSAYYIPVYKKTEKIVCAVFLITDRTKESDNVHDIIEDTKRTSLASLKSVIGFLSGGHTKAGASECMMQLSSLRSLLHVLATVKLIKPEFLSILVHEIDTVLAHLHTRFNAEGAEEVLGEEQEEPSYVSKERTRRPPHIPAGVIRARTETRHALPPSGAVDRRASIVNIIREKGVVSIKDISDTIKDCSEKTIQRELTDMIKDGIVIKEGERRWSRYKLIASV